MEQKTKRGWKQDRDRVSAKQGYEPKTVQAAMRREGITVPVAVIRDFIARFGHGRDVLYSLLRIHNAAKGLLYTSESDYPFLLVHYGSDFVRPANARTVYIDDFFKNKELGHLKSVLQKELRDINVFRLGEIEIDAYVIGRLPNGDYAGVSTKLVET